MWSLLAVTPAVQMTRIDVGGNRAGTQTGYTAYGFTGQVRVLIEGINTTEGTDGAGFYFDYSSLEEVFMGTTGQGAEMPNPGVQSQFIAKSGGNQFSRRGLPRLVQQRDAGHEHPRRRSIARGIREGSNEMDRYYDTAINVGGPIKKDKIWWFGTYRTAVQRGRPAAVPLRQDVRHQAVERRSARAPTRSTRRTRSSATTSGARSCSRTACRRAPTPTPTPARPSSRTRAAGSTRVSGTARVSDKLYVEARYGDFGYYFPQIANSDLGYWFRDTTNLDARGLAAAPAERPRPQAAHRRRHLLPRHRQGQPHLQGRRRAAEGEAVGRLPAAASAATATCSTPTAVASQVVFWFPTAARRGLARAPTTTATRSSATTSTCSAPSSTTPGASAASPSTWARAATATTTGRRSRSRWRSRTARRSCRSPTETFAAHGRQHLELVRAAHRRGLRPVGRRQVGDQGQLRPLLAQPRRRPRRPTSTPTSRRRTSRSRGTTSTATAAGSRVRRAAGHGQQPRRRASRRIRT